MPAKVTPVALTTAIVLLVRNLIPPPPLRLQRPPGCTACSLDDKLVRIYVSPAYTLLDRVGMPLVDGFPPIFGATRTLGMLERFNRWVVSIGGWEGGEEPSRPLVATRLSKASSKQIVSGDAALAHYLDAPAFGTGKCDRRPLFWPATGHAPR